MKKLGVMLLNTVFFTIVIVLAFSVATIALTRKVNRYRAQLQQGMKVTVIKNEVPVLANTRGVIKKLPAKVGMEVKKNAVLVQLDNPALRSKIDVLGEYEDNISAQTEAKVAEEELKGLIIRSPVSGVIAEIKVSEGSPVESLNKFMTIYSHKDTQLLAQLSVAQYQTLKNLSEVRAYSPRLNQNFILKPHTLSPRADETEPAQEKKIGLYFKLVNEGDASSLLHNEDLDIVPDNRQNKIVKPVDYFVDFWNGLLLLNNE